MMVNAKQFTATAKSRFGLAIAALLLVVLAFPGFGLGQKKEKLAKTYRDWLDRDVVYIITKDERDAFLSLATDDSRDKFMREFWEIRNPNPGSPTNSYQEEIYQRISFANSRFGVGSGTDGWRTPRGQTYITLGPPQQKQIYRNAANLRPIEVWFYSGASPSLPTAFYVMFYDKDGSGYYRFYSPYFDGPDKLTTGVEATNSPQAGLRMIIDSVGGELARQSLSLIVGEPVDLSDPRPSLQSDTMLTILKSLANQPANRDDISRRRMMRESVTSRMIAEGRNLDIITLPVRDTRGLTRLDYAIRLRNPSDLTLSVGNDDRFTYSVQVQVLVFGDKDKLIFTQQKSVSEAFDKRHYSEIKDKAFSYEGMLPLPPGKYRLAFQFTDWTKSTSYRTEREVTIPAPAADTLVVPGILPFLSAEQVDPATAEITPFTLAGVKFTSLPTNGLVLNPDVPLQVAYQIWAPPKDPRSYVGQKVHVDYVLGMPAAPGSTNTVQDEADMRQFDAGGSLVNGKRLDLEGRQNGNYLLTISLKNTASQQLGFTTLNFKVVDGTPTAAPWEVVEPTITKDMESGVFDQDRGLCYLAQGLLDEGRGWLRRALKTNHGNELARARLVQAYYSQKDYAAVTSLYRDSGITEGADAETYLRIATSLEKTGNLKEAIALAEAGIQSHPRDVPLYLGLADFYRQIGDTQKAEEMIKLGRSYAPAS